MRLNKKFLAFFLSILLVIPSVSGSAFAKALEGLESSSQDSVALLEADDAATEGDEPASMEGDTGNAKALSTLGGPVLFNGGGSKDVTSLLTELKGVVEQFGAIISEDGEIDLDDPFNVLLSFGVPVKGDDPYPGDDGVVQQGDTARFPIGKDLVFPAMPTEGFVFESGGLTVGHLFLETDTDGTVYAVIVFDGDERVFSGQRSDVNCNATLNFSFVEESEGGPSPGDFVEILDKTYLAKKAEIPEDYSVTKTGNVDLSDKKVDWEVSLTGKQGESFLDLVGKTFSDNLSPVGDFIAGSFTVETTSGPVSASPQWDSSTKMLTYDLPADSVSPVTVRFSTEIPDAKYYGEGSQSIGNTAKLLDGETELDKGSKSLKFDSEWIKKAGSSSEEGSSGDYNPIDRTITWTITINANGASLPNAWVEDVFDADLTFDSINSYYQIWDEAAGDWSATQSALAYNSSNKRFEFPGGITTPVLLTVVTKVPDAVDPVTDITTYTNSATLGWEGHDGIGSNGVDVGIGYNAISKSGALDPAIRTVDWSVTVSPRGQNISNMKVYDLLVYGDAASFSASAATGGDGINLASLTPKYGQTHIDGTFSGDTGLSAQLYPITQNGVVVADLLAVEGFSPNESRSFSFKSEILNEEVYGSNGWASVLNTASLFSGSTKLSEATAEVGFYWRLLDKTMLDRSAMSDPAAGANNIAAGLNSGFDYIENAAIFRIETNAAGVDLTDALGGSVKLSDQLPAGWVFTEIASGVPFYIFTGTTQTDSQGNPSGVSADPLSPIADYSGFLTTNDFIGGTEANFEFSTLGQPYVILVKAKLTDETIDEFFSKTQSRTDRNTATLSKEDGEGLTNSYQDITLKNELFAKGVDRPSDGVLSWSISYNPHGQDRGDVVIEDEIPVGVDLRLNSKGGLAYVDGSGTANIVLEEMDIQANGNLVPFNPAVTVPLDSTVVSYDVDTRVLTVNLPDSNKAYRFSYITDITGEDTTAPIKNSAKLSGFDVENEGTESSYWILSSDISSSMQSSNYLEINKSDSTGDVKLEGAEFQLLSSPERDTVFSGETNDKGILRFKKIPAGSYILVETKAPSGYNESSQEWEVEVTLDSEGDYLITIDGRPLTFGEILHLKNYQSSELSDVSLTKTVAGNRGETDREFTFTFYTDAEGGFGYVDASGDPLGTLRDGDTFTLKHGETITVKDLPLGSEYEFVEDDYSSEGYVTESTGAEDTVSEETPAAAFLNTKQVLSNVSVEKMVAGNRGETDRAFTFTFYTDAEGEFGYVDAASGDPLGVLQDGDTFTLKHGEAITVEGIPLDSEYEFVEDDYSDEGYVTETSNTKGIVDEESPMASFLNTKQVLSNVSVEKTVAGNRGETDRAFVFTFYTDDEGEFEYTDASGEPLGTIKNGDTFTLKHGEAITVEGIPLDSEYEFVEDDYTDEGYVTEASDTEGIVDEENPTAAFLNTKQVLGDVSIEKIVSGDEGETDREFTFTFNTDAEGEFEYEGTEGIEPGVIQDGDTFTLKHGQKIIISGLALDDWYKFTEEDYSSDGYVTTSTDAEGLVGEGSDTAVFENNKESEKATPVPKPVPGTKVPRTGDDPLKLLLLGLASMAGIVGLGLATRRLRRIQN